MTQQIIGIGTTANDGTGDSPRSAGGKINQNFTEIYARASQADKAARRAFVKMMHDGDSKTGEALAAATWLAAKYGLDVWVGAAALGVGGATTGNSNSAPAGLTSTSRLSAMNTAVAAEVAAGWTVDMTLVVGTNDISGGIATETSMANVRKYHNAFRSAGGRYLLIFGIDPRGTSGSPLTAAQARALLSYNQAVEQYCRIASDAFFIDCSPWTVDPASSNATFLPLGGGTGVAFTLAPDGLHCAAYGSYIKQFALEPVMRQLYRARVKAPPSAASVYNASDAPRANILGATGRMQAATGGYNSSTGGTVTGTPPTDWNLTGDLKGLTLAFTTVNSTQLAAAFGLASYPVVRMTWSGTPTANGMFSLVRFVSLAQQNAQPFRGEAMLGFNAFTGSFGFNLTTQNVSPAAATFLGSLSSPSGLVAADQLPALDGLYNVQLFTVPTSNINSGLNLNFNFLSGIAVSGSVDLIGASWAPFLDPPAASA